MTQAIVAPADVRLTLASGLWLGWSAEENLALARTGHAFTHARTSDASVEDSTGAITRIGFGALARSVRAGVAGLDIMPGRINHLLRSRDLSHAAWVKTNCTALLEEVGVDGQAAQATRVTASAGNATVLQDLTLTSGARSVSAHVRRITGSGTVEMTVDGGSTWVAVPVTSAWARVAIPAQTLADPSVGIRLVTSGDAIAVDLVQCETGGFPTAPILTTTEAVTRQGDNYSTSTGVRIPPTFTVALQAHRAPWMDLSGDFGSAQYLLGLGSGPPRFALYGLAATRTIRAEMLDGAAASITRDLAIPAGALLTVVLQARTLSTAPQIRLSVGGDFTDWSSVGAPFANLGGGVLRLGDAADAPGQQFGGGICRAHLHPTLADGADVLEWL